MRVPDPAPARMLIWCGILAAVLAFGAPPVPAEVAPVHAGGVCVLADANAGPRCPCEQWPGRLRLLADLRVPLSTAGPADLEAVPGIGPVRARSIVRERRMSGPFESLDALARVRGIGPRTVERLRPYLSPTEECGGA